MKLRAAFPTVTVTAAVILCGVLLPPAALPHSAAALFLTEATRY